MVVDRARLPNEGALATILGWGAGPRTPNGAFSAPRVSTSTPITARQYYTNAPIDLMVFSASCLQVFGAVGRANKPCRQDDKPLWQIT